MRRRKGFTLIELLVVIAIIALLVSILMPALGKAKEQAKAVACMSNQKQIVTAFKLYTSDWDGRIMGMEYDERYWFNQIAPYLGDKNFRKDTGGIDGTKGVMQVGICHSTRVDEGRTQETGTDKLTWQFGSGTSKTYGSYGVNAYLLEDVHGYGGNISSACPEANYFRSKSYDTIAGDVPVLSDSVWVDSWPDGDGTVPTTDLTGSGWGSIDTPDFAHSKDKFMGRLCIDRHSMAINVGFVDAHVEKSKFT